LIDDPVHDQNALARLARRNGIQHDIAHGVLLSRSHDQQIAVFVRRQHRITRDPDQLCRAAEGHRPVPCHDGNHCREDRQPER
jgi:hypothetical protein